jgi:hypothetical protein
MRNIITKIIAITCFAFSNLNVYSQSFENYKLLSLDNKECSISLELDAAKENVKVKLNANEVLCINGFKGLEQGVNVLNQKFLELRIKTRGGSGVAMRRYILICVSDNKLVKAIDILSMISSEFKETYAPSIDSLNQYDESSIYKLTFTITQNDNDFKLIAIESETVQSKKNPSKNHDTKDLLQFDFDMNMKVFYNQLVSLNGVFTIDSDDGNPTISNQFGEDKYPTIKLKNEKYYYINHVWYINDGKNHLTKFSNTCN